MSEERSVEDRLDQIEKDIEELAFGFRELLTWKRNQATRSLPTQHSLSTQHEELLDDADERAKKKEQNWVTE